MADARRGAVVAETRMRAKIGVQPVLVRGAGPASDRRPARLMADLEQIARSRYSQRTRAAAGRDQGADRAHRPADRPRHDRFRTAPGGGAAEWRDGTAGGRTAGGAARVAAGAEPRVRLRGTHQDRRRAQSDAGHEQGADRGCRAQCAADARESDSRSWRRPCRHPAGYAAHRLRGDARSQHPVADRHHPRQRQRGRRP